MPDTATFAPAVARYVLAALERQHATREVRYHPDGASPPRTKTLNALRQLVSNAASDAISEWDDENRRLGFGSVSMSRFTDFRPFLRALPNVPAAALEVGDPIPL